MSALGQKHDPFSVLGVDPRFDLDLEMLEARHRELSKALHPDRFAQSPAGERRQALSRAMQVNEAWRELKDPVRRGAALLNQMGVEVTEHNEPVAAPSLLLEIMEAREELASARERRDRKLFDNLKQQVQTRERQLLSTLDARFEALRATRTTSARGAIAAADTEEVELRRGLAALRYYQRFTEEVRNIEDELD